MKKGMGIFLTVAGVLLAMIVIVLALPFLVDFNRFRPEIQAAVEKSINAKVDFASARLTVLTGLGFKLEGVTITNTSEDFAGVQVLEVGELVFSAEIAPLFKGRIEGTSVLDKAILKIVRKGNKNNLSSLVKQNDSDVKMSESTPLTEKSTAGAKSDKPYFDTNEFIIKQFSLKNAQILLIDSTTDSEKVKMNLSNLDIVVKNVGMNRDIDIGVSTSLDYRDGEALVSGPILAHFIVNPKVDVMVFQGASVNGSVDLGKLDINYNNAFKKAATIPFRVELDGLYKQDSLVVNRLDLILNTLTANATAQFTNLSALVGELTLKIDERNLEGLGEILPQHRELLSKGSLSLNADLKGIFTVPGKTAANLKLGLALVGSDVSLDLKTTSLDGPVGSLKIESKRFDADAVLKPFLSEKMTETASKSTETSLPTSVGNDVPSSAQPTASSEAKTEEVELGSEEKERFQKLDFLVATSFQELIYNKITVRNILCDLAFENISMTLNRCSGDVFSGSIALKANADLSSKPVKYQGDVNLQNIQIEDVVSLLKPEHKDLIKGQTQVQLSFFGAGTTKETVAQTLNGTGVFEIKSGELNTASIAKLIETDFEKFLGNLSVMEAGDKIFSEAEKILKSPLAEKLGATKNFDIQKYKNEYEKVKGLQVSDPLSQDKNIKDLKGKIEIKNGKVLITSQKSNPSGDLKFASTVGVIDLSLSGKGTFTASQRLKDKMLEQSKYASLLFDAQNALSFDLDLSGTVTDPAVTLALEPVRNRFMKNAQIVLEREVKQGAQDLLNKALKGQAEGAINELKKERDSLSEKLKSDAESKKLEEDAKKALDKAKAKLKGFFGK